MPYAPQVQPRGDQYLFQGINSAGESIGEAIAKLGQEHKEAKGYHSLLTALAPQLGLEKEDIDNMSLEEAKGKLQAVALKKTLGDIGLDEAQHDSILQQIQTRAAQVKAGKTFQDAVAKYTQPQANLTAPPGELYSRIASAAGGGPSPVALTPGRDLDAPAALQLGLTSGMDPERMAPLMVALNRMRDAGEQFNFDPSKGVVTLPGLPGRYFVQTSKGGGQVVEDTEAIAAEARAKQGAKPSVRFKAVPRPFQPGQFDTTVEADNPEDFKAGMDLLRQSQNPGSAPAAKPAGPVPLPSDRSQWQKGQTYLTNKGHLLWDGTQFQVSTNAPAP